MHRRSAAAPVVCALLLAAAGGTLGAQTDVKGSSDHPIFPARMPGYSISNYNQQGFSSYAFRTKPVTNVEGKYTRIHYYLNNTGQHPGGLAIRRNYENAVKNAGGEIVFSDNNVSVLKAARDGVEVWAEVGAPLNYAGRIYFLNIVERQAMQQVITANVMGAAIDKDGFIALDIHFATGKADILPESKPIVDEIAALLKSRPTLRVGIEGHTDNTGTPAGNEVLSDARAKSVAAAVSRAGVDSSRLFPAGLGERRPIADNRTEEGRAKNRRVEVTKKK